VVLEGFHALKHALRFGAVIEEVVSPEPAAVVRLAEDLAPELAGRLASIVHPVSQALFRTLAAVPPRTGVLALARRPSTDLPAILGGTGAEWTVLLDRPSNLGNVGAVVRVAAAAGAGAVLTTGPLDPWHPAALRGSAGLHFALPVVGLAELPPLTREIVGLDPAGEPLHPASITQGAILAFGSERGGLSPEVLARAGRRLSIPMRAGVSSLNLATAVAVVLYGLGGSNVAEPPQRLRLP
jgi:TrmH family RNA methyltransferase